MKRVALVNPRYGTDLVGSAEYYTRMIAEHLAQRYEVEVLTTKARDPATWQDWYARDVEVLHGVTVRRFSVERPRDPDFDEFRASYLEDMRAGHRNLSQERLWYEKQGPYAPACIRYIRSNAKAYDSIFFIGYDNYLSVNGLPESAGRGILIPAAMEHPCLYFLLNETLFTLPRAFVFLSDEERRLVRRRFLRSEPIPCVVCGTGVDVPEQVDPAHFLRRLGLFEPYLLYVGKLDAKRDCPMMLQYFMEYRRRNEGSLKLVLMGKIECQIPQHPDILPLGVVSEDEKYQGMAGSTALLIPARQERLPIAMLESMALSVPILVNGDSKTLRAHCLKGNCGLFYQNYFEFEGAVSYLLQNPVAYMQLCNNAKKYMLENYGWAEILRKFDSLIAPRTPKKEAIS